MKQLIQTLADGSIKIDEVPIPSLSDTFVLVRNRASVISSGTERDLIQLGKKNLIQQALARPDLVKKVRSKLKREGFGKTLDAVNARIKNPAPLGYSCSGSLIAIGGKVKGLQVGDRVACAGAGYANHAQVIAVPQNLVVKLPAGVGYEDAAMTTLGAIALQGLRLANPQLGETCLVLGLGLVGQLMVQLLQANSCRVIATDLNADLVERAEACQAIGVYSENRLADTCARLTGGHGVDAVLVCASSTSRQIIETCGEITREKGRVVVVGNIPLDIPRDTFYRKEINLVISRSYGPGRYDSTYEEAGQDYPYAYVRFTEQRNMQTFVELLEQKKLPIQSLISHRFTIDDALQAYQLLEGKLKEPYLGILLTYPGEDIDERAIPTRLATQPTSPTAGISFYGAGNYARSSLLPLLKTMDTVTLKGVSTATGYRAKQVATQFGFQFCCTGIDELLTDTTQALMVTSPHNTHAQATISALAQNKHVYVEKPLALSRDHIEAVANALRQSSATLMVGFNRRFAAATQLLRDHFGNLSVPLVIDIRVNAGPVPKDHWIQDPDIGGGRIIGEVCHFVDLAAALTGSLPIQVYSVGLASSQGSPLLNDNVQISLTFKEGSIATITYIADGAQSMPKEYIQVFGGGYSAVINDFRELILYNNRRQRQLLKSKKQDKGQRQMLSTWVKRMSCNEACIDPEILFSVSRATIAATESLAIGLPVDI